MQLSYKFRMYPTKEQTGNLSRALTICRQLYNYFLSQLRASERIPSRLELQAQLPRMKKEIPELRSVHSKVLQMVLYQLYSNLRALSRLKSKGKKVGPLRYKGEGRFKTIVYNQFGFKLMRTGKRSDLLHLSKIGDIPIRVHREANGKIKQIVIKKTASGKWFAYIGVDTNPIGHQESEHAIGIDVGTRNFLTDSDGRQVENPKFYEHSLKRIVKEQKDLARKKKGSNNREKQRIRLARVHERLVCQRDDFLHKLSRFYASNYGLIAVEDLDIRNMLRKHYLAGRILDASWRKFTHYLDYKAESAGNRVVRVNPRGTSQIYDHGDLDRDYNAAINILERGLDKLGMGQPEFTPVDIVPLRLIPASTVVESGSPI